jgi:hypothetical protein
LWLQMSQVRLRRAVPLRLFHRRWLREGILAARGAEPRDRGASFFPLQLAVVLSPRADQEPGDFQGGEFLLCDVPETSKARRRQIPAGLGDALLFCTRDRLVRIGGAYGLQEVKHGMAPLTSGGRMVLGVPFHEYR